MYQDFHERIEDWLDLGGGDERHDGMDEFPEFLLQLPDVEDHTLDRIAILGEN